MSLFELDLDEMVGLLNIDLKRLTVSASFLSSAHESEFKGKILDFPLASL